MEERTYQSRDIYERLEISSSSLRKWCLLLESKGYIFARDTKNNRVFRESDLNVLERYKTLVQDNGVSQEIAAYVICNPTDPNISSMLGLLNNAGNGTEQRENDVLPALSERINQTLSDWTVEQGKQTKLLEKQNELIEKLIERNEALEKEIREVKLTIASTQEKEGRGWLSRLFKK